MDKTILAAKQTDIAAHDRVPVGVGLDVCLDGSPASKVAPGEVPGNDMNVPGLLHHGIVDGDFLTGGEQFPQDGSFRIGEQGRRDGVHDPGDLWRISAQLAGDGLHVPDEDARIPEVVSVREIGLCRRSIGFFLEGRYFHDFPGHGFSRVNVAVAGLRARRGDAHGDDGVGPVRHGKRLLDGVGELRGPENQRVSRGDDDVGSGIALGDLPAGIGDAGGRVPGLRLRQDLVGRDIRQLFPDDVHIFLGGDHPELVRGAHGQEALHRQLDE